LLKHIFGETDYEGVVCIEIAPVQWQRFMKAAFNLGSGKNVLD
jgi:hypothetical protein